MPPELRTNDIPPRVFRVGFQGNANHWAFWFEEALYYAKLLKRKGVQQPSPVLRSQPWPYISNHGRTGGHYLPVGDATQAAF